ncbi:MAG: hypothetical protein ACLVGL_03635 [Waltera sp.]
MTEANHGIQEGKEKMKEREIDLLDMIADILSHWRGLLIAIVLGAVLLGAFSYTRSYRNTQNMQSQEAENTSEDEMAIEEKLAQLSENLDDSQLAAVLTTVDDAKEYALKKQYVQDSIYMQLDPMNVAQEELIYNIQGKDESESQRLGTIYRSILNSVGLYDWIEQRTGLEAAYVGELVSVSVDSGLTLTNGEPLTIGGSDSLKIIIRGVDAESCGKIAEAVKTYIEQQQENLNTRLGSHELVLLSEVSGNIMNMDVMNQQTVYRNLIYGLETTIAAAKAAFSERPKTVLYASDEGKRFGRYDRCRTEHCGRGAAGSGKSCGKQEICGAGSCPVRLYICCGPVYGVYF